MTALKNASFRMIVHEPAGWKINLFGKILSDRGGERLLVRLMAPIQLNGMTAHLLALFPETPGERFNTLAKYYSVMVKGQLVDEKGEPANEATIRGSITLD